MNRQDMLAGLIAQAASAGGDMVTLRAIVEESSELGAERVLHRMSDPIIFDTTSPRFALPLLFAGQAQKEVFVNEALARLDGLVHCAIEGTASVPPAAPLEGDCWLIGDGPSGDWSGQAGRLALRQSGQWLFVAAADGTQLLNKATGQIWRRVSSSWNAPSPPTAPSGGTTVDNEARTALAELIAALRQAGVFSA